MKEYTPDDSMYKILEMENQFIEIKGNELFGDWWAGRIMRRNTRALETFSR